MKKAISIREQLGLSQEDLAMFLKVSRIQLAMFETGRRDIPLSSKLKLTQIEIFLYQDGNDFQIPIEIANWQMEKAILFLQQEKLINEHKTQIVKRKLNKIKKAYKQNLKLLRVIDFLNESNDVDELESALLKVFYNQAIKGIKENGLKEQIKFQLKLDSHLQYDSLLEKLKLIVNQNDEL